MISYVKGGMKASVIREQDNDANIWIQEALEWRVEKSS